MFTAKLASDLQLSWAIDGEWLWLHVATKPGGARWFENSHKPLGADWFANWQWAQQLAQTTGLVGFAKLREVTASLARRFPDAAACASQFEPVERVGTA